MARLRKRKDRGGKYELGYVDVDGRRYRVNTGTTDKRLADLWRRKVEDLVSQAKLGYIKRVGRVDAEIIARKAKRKTSLTLKQFKQAYAERARHDIELAESTIDTTKYAIDSFVSVVGNKRLSDITDNDVIKWKKKLAQEDKTKTTISIYHRQIRTALNRAVTWEMVETNPFTRVEVAKYEKEEREEKDMSYEEVKALLGKIDEANETRFGIFVRFVLYTGCRRNEILYLRYEDINLENRSLKIWSDKPSRKMILPINKALKRVIDGMELEDSGYIFQTESNSRGARFREQPWHQNYVTRRFKKHIRDLKFPEHYTLHSLRHTYSTYLRQQGVPVDIVQKLLGHSSPRVTSDTYDHSVALHFREQADLVDFEGENT